MDSSTNNLKWMCFTGQQDDYPIWSTRFRAFAQTKGLLDVLNGTEARPVRPQPLAVDATDGARVAHEANVERYERAVAEVMNSRNTLWCYLAMVLDNTSLMLIKHDCLDRNGTGDGAKAWQLLQRRFQSEETVTVVSVMRQLAKLKLRDDEDLPKFFIRAQELLARLEHAGEQLSEPLFNAMVLNGLPDRYEHFVIQESFHPADSFVELRKRLTNYEESRAHRENSEETHVAMSSKTFKKRQNYTSSSKIQGNRVKAKGPCYCCGIPGHFVSDCRKRIGAECSICKQKGHLDKACEIRRQNSKPTPSTSLATSFKSENEVFSGASKNDFILDSGSTDHVIVNRDWFVSYRAVSSKVINPDGAVTNVLGIGDVELLARNVKGKLARLKFENVLHVPDYKTNLLSVANIINKGHSIFHARSKSILCLKTKEKFEIKQKGKLFFFRCFRETKPSCHLSGGMQNLAELWHKRMGHLNFADMKTTLNMKLSEADTNCETCALAKITKVSVPKLNESRATKSLERVYSDIMGPINPSSIHGFRFIVTFIDDYSSFGVVKFLKHKSEVLSKFKEFVAQNGRPNIIRSDNGTEYTSKMFKDYCVENKIKQEFTVPETPEQNGVAERYNRTIVEMARSLLIEAQLPKVYWLRAVDTAAYIRNLVVRKDETKSAFEKFKARQPKTEHLKRFGCLAFVKNRGKEKSKFDAKSKRHIFLGYEENSTAYVLQDLESKKRVTARNVIFHENKDASYARQNLIDENDVFFILDLDKKKNVQRTERETLRNERQNLFVEEQEDTLSDIKEEISSSEESAEYTGVEKAVNQEPGPSTVEVRAKIPRSSKIPVPVSRNQTVDFDSPFSKRLRESYPVIICPEYYKNPLPTKPKGLVGKLKDLTKRNEPALKRQDRTRQPPMRYGSSYSHGTTKIDLPAEPQTYGEALESEEKELWLEAMKKEVQALEGSNTWNLVERKRDQNVLPGKWVYKIKTDSNGAIDSYKARYVAKGYKQIEGIDFMETFAPTSKPETFRILLSIAAKENFLLKQMDVKSAYLHPKVEESIYLEQPPGFEKLSEKNEKLVCKLNKSIYGLKQAAKNWYEELANFLIGEGFTRSKNDYCLFSKIGKEKVYLLTWVDDIVIAGSSETEIEKLKKALETKFKMDDRGDLEWFLGMKVSRTKDAISLDQETYTNSVLAKFNMEDCKPVKTPAEVNVKFEKSKEGDELVDETLYRSLIGSLLYLSKQTRPDIAWIVNTLSRFMEKPNIEHWNGSKRVLRYLKATSKLRIVYPCDNNFQLNGGSDADWSGDIEDRKSTTGYFFKLGYSGGCVSWQTKKQQTVALSSCEAEYQGLAATTQEAVFLRSLLNEMGYPQSKPTTIGEDNQSCIKLATNPVMHKRSKHIDTKYHFIREKIDDNSIELMYVPSEDLAADLLTKALAQVKVDKHRQYLLGRVQILPQQPEQSEWGC